jgi:large subunit ribosomal protein L1
MARISKRKKGIEKAVGQLKKKYKLEEALEIIKKCPKVKFDESVELSVKLGVDPKKSDQQVRGTTTLPHGSGKKIKVLVLAKGDKEKEAVDAKADFAGSDELIEKIKGGWTGFDIMIATPDMMREVGKLGKILGPRGLMPSPKAGTVTQDVKKAVNDAKAGKIEFKVDKSSCINLSLAKVSFDSKKIEDNIMCVMKALQKAKPVSAKGAYIKSMAISSTMGPGFKIDLQTVSFI